MKRTEKSTKMWPLAGGREVRAGHVLPEGAGRCEGPGAGHGLAAACRGRRARERQAHDPHVMDAMHDDREHTTDAPAHIRISVEVECELENEKRHAEMNPWINWTALHTHTSTMHRNELEIMRACILS